VKTGCDVIQAQEEVVKNKEAELENTRKQLKEKSEGLSLKEAEFIDLEKVRIDIKIFKCDVLAIALLRIKIFLLPCI
jgi:hypothetical protein